MILKDRYKTTKVRYKVSKISRVSHLLDFDRLDTAGQVVETLYTNDRVRQPGLAQQLFPPRVVVALRVNLLQSLPNEKQHTIEIAKNRRSGAQGSEGGITQS